MATLLTTDADFLAAERQLVELRAEREALSPSVKTLDDEKSKAYAADQDLAAKAAAGKISEC
jgi:cell division protein FtsB